MNRDRSHLQSALARLLGRGDATRGDELLDDVGELFADRRAQMGLARAVVRATWDIVSIAVRRRAPSVPPEHQPRRSVMSRLSDELRNAARVVVRRPVVSGTVTLSLGLGLGLAVLAVTVVDVLLVRPLPFPHGDRLLFVATEFRPESGLTFAQFALSWPEYLDYQRQNHTVDLAAFQQATITLTGGSGDPERVPAVRTTSSAFALLEMNPQVGRTLSAANDEPGAACGAVLSDGLWRDRFGRAGDVVGRAIDVGGTPCEVIGVMPPGFNYPSERTRLWLPLGVDRDPNGRGSHGIVAIGRLKDHTTLAQAQAERATLMAQWEKDSPHHKGHGVTMALLRDTLVGSIRLPLLVIGAAVAFVLLIIVANVSSLLVAHGEARRRELAVRGALGAGRLRLVRQLLFESLILSSCGGALGVALAWVGLEPILSFYPAPLPRASEIHLDGRVLLVAVALSLVIGVLVAILPAWRLTRDTLTTGLKAGDRHGGALGLRIQTSLVVTELGLSLAVTVGALLLSQSFSQMQQIPLGFSPRGLTTTVVSLPAGKARIAAQTAAFFADLTSRLRGVPGVEAAGAISNVPFVNNPPPDTFTIEGRPVAPPNEAGFVADYVTVTPGAFEALGVGLVRGRFISERDSPGAPPVAVVNETLARQFFAGADPVGQRIRYPDGVNDDTWSAWGPWITIVGLTKDMRTITPTQDPRPAIYVAHAQLPRVAYDGRSMGMVIRAPASAPEIAPLLRGLTRSLDPQGAVSAVRTMDSVIGATLANPRFMSGLMVLFACVAMVVAALGVYGIVAYGVERRTREFGLRMALGAHRGHIVRLVARQIALMLGLGVPMGLAGAAGFATWMNTLLYGVRPFDAMTYTSVAVLLAMVVVLAVIVPARRAIRVDPLVALKVD